MIKSKYIVRILIIFVLIVSLIYFFVNNENRRSLITLSSSSIEFQNFSCENFFYKQATQNEILLAQNWKFPMKEKSSDESLFKSIKDNCDNVLKSWDILNFPGRKEELGFPIAFSIMVYKDSYQVIQMLKMIYRPWNYYCIHIDLKSKLTVFNALNELTTCLNNRFNNIINTKKRVQVFWGYMSVLQADLNCMDELYNHFKSWKYFINLTGQEFPLKTNWELVRILKAYNGANNLEGTIKHRNEDRVPKENISFPMQWFKGSVHITANRKYVEFALKDDKAKEMLKVLKNAKIPDEQFFATLNYNPKSIKIQGAFVGNPDIDNVNFLTRLKNWGGYPCNSRKWVRGICIWGIQDLHTLIEAPHLFANKFHIDFQPATLKCLEKHYMTKMIKQLNNNCLTLDEKYYRSQIFVHNQLKFT